MKKFLSFFLIFFFLPATLYAYCPPAPYVSVHVRPVMPATRITQDITLTQLRDLAPHAANETPGGYTITSPLTFTPTLRIQTMTSQNPPITCAAIERVDVEFGIEQADIFIAREFPYGSCAYRAILEHEMKHIKMDESFIAAQIPYLRQKIKTISQEIGVIQTPREEMIQIFLDRVKPILEAFRAQRDSWQETLDTPREYAQVQNQCNGEITKIIQNQP
ncbi:MAG: hypothetical protein FWF24_04730 [Alphaproteobacteria bacterium]|nr:hypothetical protein [Alphaproteobacteria bacterium]